MLLCTGAKNMQQNGSAAGGMHGRSSSQPQLHHDMEGASVDSATWGSASWDAPERRSSAGNLDSPHGAGSGRAGSAGASRLGHSASTGGAAFAGFEGAVSASVHHWRRCWTAAWDAMLVRHDLK